MPYIKFKSWKDKDKAFDVRNDITARFEGEVQGLVAILNDPKYGIIQFYSNDIYLEAFDLQGINYELVSKENVTADYVKTLKERYPQYADKL